MYHDDLPDDLELGQSVAIDTETMGLVPGRDRLCLVQISKGDGHAHLVKIGVEARPAPRLCKLLADPAVEKLFHFARFDLAVLEHYLVPVQGPVYCTKIASRLCRTYTDRHGLADLVRAFLQKEISKQQQSSDWGAATLSPEQLNYAAADVLYLHALKEKLDINLAREGRTAEARACFNFLPMRARLDLAGFSELDMFAH